MQKKNKFYLKFKYKLILVLCAILALSTLVTSAVWYTHSRRIVIETLFSSMNTLLLERGRELEGLLSNIDYQTRNLAYNNSIVDRYLYNKWEDNYLNNQALQKLDENINSIYINNPQIQCIELGNEAGDNVYRGNKRGYEFIETHGIDKMVREDSTDAVAFSYQEGESQSPYIFLYRNVHYYGRKIGYCLVSINPGEVNSIFEEIFPQGTAAAVRMHTGNLLYASPNYEKNREILEKGRKIEGTHQTLRDANKEEWLVLNKAYEEKDITIAIPIERLTEDTKSRFRNIVFITLMMMLAMLFVVGMLSRWMGRNLDSLTKALQRFSDGTLDTRVELNSRDEFGKVAQAFNVMTENIRQLMEDIKRKEKEKTALEIRSLQGQINMHFLFNTLNTIKNLCYIQRVTNVEHLVNALMELLHVSMENGNDYVTLQTELDYIRHYLEIYKYKSIRPIECYMDIEPGLSEAVILKFMIQPIVENAIIHGIEGADEGEGGYIYIKAIREGKDMEITVMDNGQGFDTSKISTFNGIGLSNTQQRIKIHYGEDYGITVESTEGISTVVKVKIPYKENKIDKDSNSR